MINIIIFLILFLAGILMIIYGSIPRHWPCGHGGAKCQTDKDCNYTENLYCSQGKCLEKKTISIGMIVGGVIIFLFSILFKIFF